ncbi:MAG: hypothetical protein PUK76_00965 [Treponema sp.]|nr:hypothetical protein [Treponema sp.]
MFDFLNINNDDFLNFSKEQIDSFRNRSQMNQSTKESFQKDYDSFSRQIEEAKFYAKNGAVFFFG